MDLKFTIISFLFLVLLGTGLTACSEAPPVSSKQEANGQQIAQPPEKGCKACHVLSPDKHHNLDCTICHNGTMTTADKNIAHKNLKAFPAHPEHMLSTCGKCHKETVLKAQRNLHFTLANEINSVRSAYGATKKILSITEIPEKPVPETILDLVDDLLRRRCLRCHPYYRGDQYSATLRGTGCSACHLAYGQDSNKSHQFIAKPGDQQCLSCHYGNHVGFDYYGRFSQDLPWDYNTPFNTEQEQPPFGVEYHQLAPDIHQQKGMVCIDCHVTAGHADAVSIITCESCHLKGESHPYFAERLKNENGQTIMTSNVTGKQFRVPLASSKVHKKYRDIAACAVCHAQWSFADKGVHLLRQDEDDFDEWFALTKQESSEIQDILISTLYQDESEIEIESSDKITGQTKSGIWLKGYELRRWEPVTICKDIQGKLQVCRGILDLHLSYMGEDETFDSIQPTRSLALQPYTPHTIGKAGAFWKNRVTVQQKDDHE